MYAFIVTINHRGVIIVIRRGWSDRARLTLDALNDMITSRGEVVSVLGIQHFATLGTPGYV